MEETVFKRRRLREVINDEDTINILTKQSIKKNINCLEIGMGLGSIAEYMEKYADKNGIVDAIDMKIENVEYVKSKVSGKNINTYCMDIKDIVKLNRKYDLIHARFVFEHIKERKDVLLLLKENMNENGLLIVEDAVYDDIEYNGTESFKKLMYEYVEYIKSTSCNTSYLWGKEMYVVVQECNFSHIKTYDYIRVFRGGGLEAEYWQSCFEELKDELVKRGVSASLMSDVNKELEDSNLIFSGPAIFSVVCLKSYLKDDI